MQTAGMGRGTESAMCVVSREEPGRADDTVTAIVLAAGAGSRFRDVGHKLTAMLPPTASRPAESVAQRSIAAAVAAAIGQVVVVTGRLARSDLGLDDGGVEIAHNADWAAGQMTSVRFGLDVADRNGSTVAVDRARRPARHRSVGLACGRRRSRATDPPRSPSRPTTDAAATRSHSTDRSGICCRPEATRAPVA